MIAIDTLKQIINHRHRFKKTKQNILTSAKKCVSPYNTGWHLRGLLRRTDSVLRRILHLLAGEPLHSTSSPRCIWCCTLSNGPLQFRQYALLPPPLLLLQQLPFAVTATWNPRWLWPLLRWKGPDAPFLSMRDLALSIGSGLASSLA